MKKLFTLLIVALLPLVASADAVKIGDLWYNLNAENKTAEVTHDPDKSYGSYSGDIVIPSNFESDGVTYAVTSIGDEAFYLSSEMTSVVIPSGITIIGKYSFGHCSSLTSIEIPEGVTEFKEYAFSGCQRLSSINIPASVRQLSGLSFRDCFGLSEITVDENNTVYDSRKDCNAIINTTENSLIVGCQNTVIPESIVRIEDYAFSGCHNLSWINIPESVTSIGICAFQNCRTLNFLYIPKSIIDMSLNPFEGCSSLEYISVDVANPIYSSPDFCNAIIYKGRKLVVGCKGTIIPGDVEEIGYNAFSGSGLTSIVIPDNVTTINDYAFSLCQNLTYIEAFAKEPLAITERVFEGISWSGKLNNVVLAVPHESVELYSNADIWKNFRIIEISSEDIPETVQIDNLWYKVESQKKKEVTIWYKNYDEWKQAPNVQSIPSYLINDDEGILITEDELTENVSIESLIGSQSWYMYLRTSWSYNTAEVVKSPAGEKMYYDSYVEIPEQITYNAKSYSVTKIGEEAFYRNQFEKGVSIPNSVTTIGNNAFNNSFIPSVSIGSGVIFIGVDAFSNCHEVESITVDANNHMYDSRNNCNAIIRTDDNALLIACMNTVIPEGVKRIQSGAFDNCYELSSLKIPASLSIIDDGTFNNCYNLTSIAVDAGNTVYDSRENCNAIIEKESDCLILGCKNTIIPNSVKIIGSHAFQSRSDLTSISIPQGVKTIGSYAFAFTALTSVVLPDGLERIMSFAFSDCDNMTELKIPASVTAIEEYAFSTTGLTSIVVDEANATFDSRQNCNAIVEKETGNLLLGCKNTVIPNDVTAIGNQAFFFCSDLTSITIPQNVKSIGYSAFSKSGLTEVAIPEGVESIYGMSFAGCESMEKVLLPSSLKEIRYGAFSDLKKLSVVTSKIATPFEIAEDVFAISERDPETRQRIDKPSPATLYVPVGTKSEYEQFVGWTKFARIVEGEPGKEAENTIPITISAAQQLAYCSDKALDFKSVKGLKAFVATGYDKATGVIWLTRVNDVPANTGFLLMGAEGSYEVPVIEGGSDSYYKNMFKGTLEAMTLQTTENGYTNYYLSNGTNGVGFYKVTNANGQSIGANRAYLPIPTEIPAVGKAGSTETIKVSAAGQVPYFSSQSLDFTSLENVKAYTATGYDYNTGTIWLTRVKQVPAETGILIMAPQGSYDVPTASVASVYGNMLKGTLTGSTIYTNEKDGAGVEYTNYYLSNGAKGVGFYKVTNEAGQAIGANRAYLPIPVQSAAGTRVASSDLTGITLQEAGEVIALPLLRGIADGSDGTTGIREVKRGEVDGEWFTLQGQRVAKPGKGVYIKNGKKVVIK